MLSSSNLIPFLPHLISSFSSNTSPLVTDDTNRFSFLPNDSTNDALLFGSLNNMAFPPPGLAMATNYMDQHNPSASFSSFLSQARKSGSKPVKKDGHSKICTAQGLRDRRVRLSIGIARKFFDLQDMLGFEKASETLEWLLNKSKKAIREAHEVRTKNNSNGSCFTTSATSSTCNAVSQIGDVFLKSDSQKKLRRSSSLKASVHMAKESRAKARARARERTRAKMNAKTSPRSDVMDPKNKTCEKLKLANHEHQTEVPNKLTSVTEESPLMVIKKKLKPNNGTLGSYYHQNHVMLKDSSCININNSINLMNSPQNWDLSGAISRSSFCAVTNINPSTGLHLCRKFWEGEGNYYPN